jgi:hypothetical protein
MNEEKQNNLPQPQSYEQSAMDELGPYLLDARKDYDEPYYMLEYNGVPFSPIGGIQALSGQKKNGKTFVIAQLIAACLEPDAPRVHENLPGLTIPHRTLEHLGHLPKVLWIDTEMEELNSAKVLRRVHWLVGQDFKVPHERFRVLWMRTVEGNTNEPAFAKRWRLIKLAIEIMQPDIVFIDGVRDIIGDFNDNAASSQLVQELMATAEKHHICIWNVLHMNPRPGNDDESKMRGHLGTELGNKVTDTLVSIKKKQGSQVTFTVKQLDARGKDLEDWQFEITEQAGALGIPRIIPQSAVQKAIQLERETEEAMLRETVRVLKEIIYPPKSEYFTNIIKGLKDKLHVGEGKAKTYFNAVREQQPNLMYQTNQSKWTMSKKEVEAYEQGLPWAPEPSEP